MLLWLLLLLLLLFSHTVCKSHTLMQVVTESLSTAHEWYQPSEILIGGIVSYIAFLFPIPSFQEPPSQIPRNNILLFPKFYQNILALVFAIKEINENPKLLPNVTLGFLIYDSYSDARMAYRTTLDLLFKSDNFLPNYKCSKHKHLMGVIGGLSSDTSFHISQILTMYKIPQLSYGSFEPAKEKGTHFSSFYHMVPNEAIQYQGIVQLLLHFRWKWVGLVTSRDETGEHFLRFIEPLFSQNGICPAIIEKVPDYLHLYAFGDIVAHLMNRTDILLQTKVNVFIIYGDTSSITFVAIILWTVTTWADLLHLEEKEKAFVTKVWITTAQIDFTFYTYLIDFEVQMFQGSISFTIHSTELIGFQKFLQNRSFSGENRDGFTKDFWEIAFDCSFSVNFTELTDEKEACTGVELLEDLPSKFFEMSMTGHSYAIYNAVYAMAHALHSFRSSMSNHRAMKVTGRLKNLVLEPWQLHSVLRRIRFNNSVGDEVLFNEDGELEAGFDITNLVTFPNNSYVRVKVGRLDPQAAPDRKFTINEDRIEWHKDLTQVPPLSQCTDICRPGYSKKKREGEKFCCYDCDQCPKGMLSDKEDTDDCFQCPEGQYPSDEKNQCLPKMVNFLSYEEPLGISLAVLALSLSGTTAMVFTIFINHRNTPIVKANNRKLTYTLLISLLLCFLCSLLFIGQPQVMICLLRQTAFGIIFSVAVASVLAKTITVVLAFTVSKPGSRMRKWLGKGFANAVVFCCSITQTIICIVWLCIDPPFPEADMNSLAEEIIVECNEGSAILFSCVLAYMGFLALVSSMVAFFARKLPDTFNEAKFITFSMLVFCCVWLSFVPAYLSAKGKYMVVVEIFSILASGAGLLGCIFPPKLYIIVWKPELNCKEQLVKSKKQRGDT